MFKSSLIHLTSLLLLFTVFGGQVLAQSKATITGTLKDENKQGIDFATVAAVGFAGGTSTDSLGNYSLEIPAGEDIKLSFSHVRYEPQSFIVKLTAGQTKQLNRILKLKENLVDEAVVADQSNRSSTMQRVDPRIAVEIPTVGGGIEAV
ncbi:MAG: carboxypeptidase-like regulatory domain-containing protein, partial [Flavobacteriales bacterium]